ncbi:hypothetical protein GCM10010389_17730 [Streptomyces echinoruber]|uniref:Uncharacterized protein n=1 Tax=Streptomyces echinoruber TaxID=68898 RepID=A0A918R173_9ACTN|nr:hypothetical protein GCM10010389_17730 [Streptomyces echinoruber]
MQTLDALFADLVDHYIGDKEHPGSSPIPPPTTSTTPFPSAPSPTSTDPEAAHHDTRQPPGSNRSDR